MKRYIAFLFILPGYVAADFQGEHGDESRFVGPTKSQVELIEVKETSPYGSDNPLAAKIKNNSDLYLDRVAIKCTITDQRGYRLFKSLVFRSKPIFSIRIAFPPISIPEAGIPPGTIAEVGLYTKDNRWTRGDGDYQYDCHMYGVSGRK